MVKQLGRRLLLEVEFDGDAMSLVRSNSLCIGAQGKALFVAGLDDFFELDKCKRETMTRRTWKQFVYAYPSFRIERYTGSSRLVS